MSWSSGLQFRVIDGKREKGRVIRLDGKELKLGRAQKGQRPGQGEILFREPTVSRVHVTLSWKARKCGFQLAHKSGTNATLVNGKSVKKILLAPGDRIQMGHLIVELESAPVNPHAQVYPDEPKSRSSMTEPILEALSKVERQHEEERIRERAEREEKKRQRELMVSPEPTDQKQAASARRSSRLEEARRNAGARPHRPERTGPVFGWQPPEEREPAPPPPPPPRPKPTPVYTAPEPHPMDEPERVIQIAMDEPIKPRRIELSGNKGDVALDRDSQDAVYELFVLRGPDQGAVFPLKDTVMVLGQRQGDEDEREGQGILLRDATLPEEIGMFAWQGREGAYGLLASENSMELIEVERFDNGRRRHIKVDSQSSILLRAGDEIRVGLSTLRVQKIGEPLPEKTVIPISTLDQTTAISPSPPREPVQSPQGETTLKALRGRSSGEAMSFREEPRPSHARPENRPQAPDPRPPSPKPEAEEPIWSQATLLPAQQSGESKAAPATPKQDQADLFPKRKLNPPVTQPVLEWDNRPQVDYLLEFTEGPLRGCQVSINESDLQRNPRLNAGKSGPRQNEIALEGADIGNEAFFLSCEGGRFSLCSESETGLLSINVSPLKNGDRVVLMSGDVISISDTKIRFMERKVVQVLSQYRLQAESGVTGDQDKLYPIGRQRLIIGRGKNCDIRLADLEVSRVHLGLAYSDGKFSVQHRSETNPTFLNGLNLLPGTVRAIKVGDRLRLSSLTVLKFVKL